MFHCGQEKKNKGEQQKSIVQDEEGMTEGSNHKGVQEKSLWFEWLGEEQLRLDKPFFLSAIVSYRRFP